MKRCMEFIKMHGCGNDYIYVDCTKVDIANEGDISIKLSDRRFGIGSDGLILIRSSNVADFKMSIYNADGSEAKMCGNGVRCVGKFVYDNGLTDKEVVKIETLSGIKILNLNVENGKVTSVKVDMGAPIIEASKVPAISPSNSDKIINEEIDVDGTKYKVTCVSMGNPHCITYVEDTSVLDLEKIGPGFEHHTMFPDRVNTEFIQVLSRNEINMRVWERGSGETFACGTGACASVVACVLNGLTDDEVKVNLVGGELYIKYDRKVDTVYMTGPATTVYSGKVYID